MSNKWGSLHKQESDYTAASWQAFQSAYGAAKALPETTQAEIVAKTETISKEIGRAHV